MKHGTDRTALDERTNPGYGSGPPRYPGTFLLAFREAIAALNWTVRRWLGDAVDCLDAEGHGHVVGLENLYRRARRAPRADWPALVREFLTQAVADDQEGDLPTNLSTVAAQVLPRLGPPFRARPGDPQLWCQPVAGTDLVVNLVVDYPNRMIYVTEDMVASSDRPGGAWLDCALANLRQRTPGEAFQPVHADAELLACTLGDAYDSARALLLDALLPIGRDDGYFVALPSRDQLLVLPVATPALTFVHLLQILVDKQYKSMPYPISDEIFWVRNGVWRPFSITIDGTKVTIQPPEEFLEVLERIGPPESADDKEEPEKA